MRRLELSPRLQTVADLVRPGARVADVGTDHAYLPAALLLEGRIPFAIAADLRQGPLERARATVREYGLTGKAAFRLCDGLRGIRPDEVDAIAIAGMGGGDNCRYFRGRSLDPRGGCAPDPAAHVLYARFEKMAGGERLSH